MKIIRGVAGVVMAVCLVAGCSGDDEPAPKATTVDPDNFTPTGLPEVPTLADAQGAVTDLTLEDCPAEPGENEVSGKVTNSSSAAADYVIVISWISERSDVVARGVATVDDLAPGASADWNLTGTSLPEGKYTCTNNVRRGNL